MLMVIYLSKGKSSAMCGARQAEKQQSGGPGAQWEEPMNFACIGASNQGGV